MTCSYYKQLITIKIKKKKDKTNENSTETKLLKANNYNSIIDRFK